MHPKQGGLHPQQPYRWVYGQKESWEKYVLIADIFHPFIWLDLQRTGQYIQAEGDPVQVNGL